jgi:hypothetical protein
MSGLRYSAEEALDEHSDENAVADGLDGRKAMT